MILPAVRIDLHINYWRFRLPLASRELGLSTNPKYNALAGLIHLGSKVVLPARAIAPISELESSARSLVRSSSIYTRCGSVIKPEVYEGVDERLEEIKAEMFAARDELVANRDDLVAEMAETYEQYAELAYSEQGGGTEEERREFVRRLILRIPNAENIRRSFHFEWGLLPILTPEQIGRSLEELISQERYAMSEKLVETAERLQKANLAETLQECVSTPARMLVEGLGKIKDSIIKQRESNGRHVRSIRSLTRSVRRLNIMENETITHVCTELDQLQTAELVVLPTLDRLVVNAESILQPSLLRFAGLAS